MLQKLKKTGDYKCAQVKNVISNVFMVCSLLHIMVYHQIVLHFIVFYFFYLPCFDDPSMPYNSIIDHLSCVSPEIN